MPRIFVCYSRKDSRWVRTAPGAEDLALIPWLAEKLRRHPSKIEFWWDEELNRNVGDAYDARIREAIDSSDTAILLLSDDFFMSDYIVEKELPLIRARVERGEMKLFPIVVSHVDWAQSEDSLWIQSRQIHPSAIEPLIELRDPASKWSKTRMDLSIALRNQIVLPQRGASEGATSESGRRGGGDSEESVRVPPSQSNAGSAAMGSPAPVSSIDLKVHSLRIDAHEKKIVISAEAVVQCVDGSTRAGIPVSFFIDGKHLRDVETDAFGRAVWEESVAPLCFPVPFGEIVSRVAGIGGCSSSRFKLLNASGTSSAQVSRVRVPDQVAALCGVYGKYRDAEELVVEISLSEEDFVSVEGVKCQVHVLDSAQSVVTNIAGTCIFSTSKILADGDSHSPEIQSLARQLRVTLDGFPSSFEMWQRSRVSRE